MADIYTKTGDQGQTSLFGGTRVAKQSPRVSAYGAVDQANAAIGVAVHYLKEPIFEKVLRAVQEKLFVVGGELASDDKGRRMLKVRVEEGDVTFLEGVLDEILKEIERKPYFVVPGKNPASAFLHVARTQVRFAEREILTLMEEETVPNPLLKFINRLSDLLFVMARYEEEVVAAVEKTSPVDRRGEAPCRMTLCLAERILDGAQAKAEALGVPLTLAVTDAHGNLVAFRRMDGALLGSVDIAQGKAYTAVAFQQDTEALREAILPGAALHGLENTLDGRVVPFGGGMPIRTAEGILGALGVSGGTVEEDIAVCRAGLEQLRGRGVI